MVCSAVFCWGRKHCRSIVNQHILECGGQYNRVGEKPFHYSRAADAPFQWHISSALAVHKKSGKGVLWYIK